MKSTQLCKCIKQIAMWNILINLEEHKLVNTASIIRLQFSSLNKMFIGKLIIYKLSIPNSQSRINRIRNNVPRCLFLLNFLLFISLDIFFDCSFYLFPSILPLLQVLLLHTQVTGFFIGHSKLYSLLVLKSSSDFNNIWSSS